MKNKKIFAILAIAFTFSCTMSACSFFGGDEPEEQVVVESTPTPEPTKEPDPTPTVIAADVQDTTYTSNTNSISIKLPDATWANKTDEADMVSFESPDQGKILILHGAGEEKMNSAVIPSIQDMAVFLERASDLEEGTDFEIQDYTTQDVNGIGVYSYTVKYLNTEKTDGVAYAVNKVFANDTEYYNFAGSVTKDDAGTLTNVKTAIESFQILGESSLKSAASSAGTTTGTADGTTADGTTDGTAAGTTDGTAADGTATDGTATDGTATDGTTADGTTEGTADTAASDGASEDVYTDYDSSGSSDDAIHDTEQTRTIYRNSDGENIVIYNDGAGNWYDDYGNSYSFVNDEDVYDQDGVDYYYHGEAADVSYMPIDYDYSEE